MTEGQETAGPAPGAAPPVIARPPGPAQKSSLWLRLVASTAAFSAYLALLGGSLLAIRFHHAGLPLAPSVGAVPFSTLITTALVELLLPAVGLVVIGVAYGFVRLDDRAMGARHSKRRVLGGCIIFGFIILILPINYYGLALLGSFLIPVLLAEWLLPPTALKETRVIVFSVVVVAIAASLPVLARQFIEPLNMERVKIERTGQPTLLADLVAIRDTSVVVARCHHLYVLPTPASMRVEQLPSILGVGASITERLIGSNNIVKPQPMPC